MTATLPSSIIGSNRNGFALIDPETNLFHHKLGRSQHVAISYCWADWTDDLDAGHNLHHWQELRKRLLKVVGSGASQFMKIRSGGATCCWLDCKCIDQDSAADKKYWIPRMDEIYSEARCTVFLMRKVHLAPLQEALKACRNFDAEKMCLVVGSWVTIPTLKPEVEAECLSLMKFISSGALRKRAWIFQEVLLSKEYILSGEDGAEISLYDLCTLAKLFQSYYPHQKELEELADWCKRLFDPRASWSAGEICDSNLLQMSTSLSTTLPCDKYYALCGVLRLRKLEYVDSHSELQALRAVILALTQAGRLSWLFAIPPAISPGIIALNSRFLPFIEHRLGQNRFRYANTRMSPSSVSFRCVCLGTVTRTSALSEVLMEAMSYVDGNASNHENMPSRILSLPSLLLLMCSEEMEPMTADARALFCRVANLPAESTVPAILMKLLAVRDFQTMNERKTAIGELIETDMFTSMAWRVQRVVNPLKDSLDLIAWSPPARLGTEYFAIGSKGCKPGSNVWVVKGDSILFAVDEVECSGGSKQFRWISTLLQPDREGEAPVFPLQIRRPGRIQQDMVFGLTEAP